MRNLLFLHPPFSFFFLLSMSFTLFPVLISGCRKMHFPLFLSPPFLFPPIFSRETVRKKSISPPLLFSFLYPPHWPLREGLNASSPLSSQPLEASLSSFFFSGGGLLISCAIFFSFFFLFSFFSSPYSPRDADVPIISPFPFLLSFFLFSPSSLHGPVVRIKRW